MFWQILIGKKMLTEEEKQALEKEVKGYVYRHAAKLSVLNWLQEKRGWISEETMKDAADFLEITGDELESVASFYNLIYRKQVGKKVIHLCNSASCWMMGEPEVREKIQKNLKVKMGETTEDGNFTLLPIVCLGNCDNAPTMLVGKKLCNKVKPEDVEKILAEEKV
jgi:NADH-quinone oxidoreductase subunit E